MIDERLIRGLHIDAADLAGSGFESRVHEVFQTSTVAALVGGAFDGDLSFAELARHGDLGLGTLNGLDGEMIAVDGEFLRADVDGRIGTIDPAERTPFAVVTRFAPTVAFDIGSPLDHHAFVKEINRHAPVGSPSCAIRVDGEFEVVHARSVPRQQPPPHGAAAGRRPAGSRDRGGHRRRRPARDRGRRVARRGSWVRPE